MYNVKKSLVQTLCSSPRDLLGVEPLEDDVFESELLISKGRTPRRREATPRRAGLREHK